MYNLTFHDPQNPSSVYTQVTPGGAASEGGRGFVYHQESGGVWFGSSGDSVPARAVG